MHAIFSVVSSECSACYCTAVEQYVFLYMRKGSSKWCDMVTCFKQQTVIEFVLEEDSVTNIHIQLKNVCGVNALDIGTVIHWASRTAGCENNHMELSDTHCLDWPTTAVTQAWLNMVVTQAI
jgi:hypothetical protein